MRYLLVFCTNWFHLAHTPHRAVPGRLPQQVLLWMLFDVQENACVAFDLEVESNVVVYSCLPNVACFIVFLRVEGGMTEISEEKVDLFFEFF
jgi:hypothetical protein